MKMLNKAIEHGKEKRKPYRGAKSVSSSCCNNGGCPYCLSNRIHKNKKRLQSAQDSIRAARMDGSLPLLTVRTIHQFPCSVAAFFASAGGFPAPLLM